MDQLSISFISLINCFESSFLPLEGKKNEGIKHSIHGDPSAIMCLIGGDGNTGRYWQNTSGSQANTACQTTACDMLQPW